MGRRGRLDGRPDAGSRRFEAVELTSPGRARVWRLYMAASAAGFENNTMGVNQVLSIRTDGDGRSGMPLRRDFLGTPASALA